VVWPEWFSRVYVEIIVLENIASWLHFAAAVALGVLGCGRRVFWAYTAYQVYTTLAKLAAFPGVEAGVWPSDMLGDIFEFAAGLGLVAAAGLEGRARLPPWAAAACGWRGVLAGLAALTLVWLVFFAKSLWP